MTGNVQLYLTDAICGANPPTVSDGRALCSFVLRVKTAAGFVAAPAYRITVLNRAFTFRVYPAASLNLSGSDAAQC